MDQLEFIRNGGETRRFHTWPVLRPQTVAEHSFHVAMLIWALYGDSPGVRLPLIMAALTHDLAEWKVGDIPSPAKRQMSGTFPDFRERWGEMEQRILRVEYLDWEHQLTPEELRMLKFADCAEGAMYCIRERSMGNRLIEPCFQNFRRYLRELASDVVTELPEEEFSPEEDFLTYIDSAWEIANG